MKSIIIKENGLEARLQTNEDGVLSLLYFGKEDPQSWEIAKEALWTNSFMELQLSGAGTVAFPGMKIAGTLPGIHMRYQRHKIVANDVGNRYEFMLVDPEKKIEVRVFWQFYRDIPILRAYGEVKNISKETVGLEYISSFKLPYFDRTDGGKRSDNVVVSIPHNAWFCEVDWKQQTMAELGFESDTWDSSKRLYYGNTSTFSTNQYLPMGLLENRRLGGHYFFQLENQGAWNWEISLNQEVSQLVLSGPEDQDNQAYRALPPGETFQTIPIAIGYADGVLSNSIQELTKYRRKIRRQNRDNEELPVIFNDYMNCLMGDPTTEKELPLIKAAAKVGCEVFCIDCGWYADADVSWWPSIGDWQPSKTRFPEGITYLTNYIKEQGMIPGLWLELESAGVSSELAKTKPDSWFFTRHGKRVVNRERLQLDFRNPEVRAYCFDVVKRLVEEYGVGYIKMDYNINAGVGPEIDCDSYGAGLLDNNRAHLNWLRSIFEAFPELTIENCSSGGMRMDYAMLAECSLQSVTDQTSLLENAQIAAFAATAVTPEQAAIWSYPNKDETESAVIMNMVNAMLGRIHQSGFIQEMAPEKLALVQEGIACYKEYRHLLKAGLPFWPTGITKNPFYNSYGIINQETILLAVWNFEKKQSVKINLADYTNQRAVRSARVIYPMCQQGAVTIENTEVQVALNEQSACILEIKM